MPARLKRYQQTNGEHFLTWSCWRRCSLLGTARRRDLFLRVLEQVRRKFRFVVSGYVVMPEHVHLLVSEPERGTLANAIQVLKQKVARRLLPKGREGQAQLWDEEPHFWQKRYYDFNVWSGKKRIEKLRYMHRNPVKRGLVASSELWAWGSFREYALGEKGPVKLNDWPAMRVRKIQQGRN